MRAMARLLPQREVEHHGDGFRIKLDLAEMIDSRIYYTGVWDPQTVDALKELLRPGMVAVDIGAQIGYMTLLMASRVGPQGQVLAFEPSEWAYSRLVRNVELNGMQWVVANRLAVSDRAQTGVRLTLPCGYPLDGHDTSEEQLVDITTLDAYCERYPVDRLDVIKTDTDGMEPAVIAGAQKTLLQFKPAVLFEVHPHWLATNNSSPAALFEVFGALGFDLYEEFDLSTPIDASAVIEKIPTGGSTNLVARHAESIQPGRDTTYRGA